jgi:hypothetical protein
VASVLKISFNAAGDDIARLGELTSQATAARLPRGAAARVRAGGRHDFLAAGTAARHSR